MAPGAMGRRLAAALILLRPGPALSDGSGSGGAPPSAFSAGYLTDAAVTSQCWSTALGTAGSGSGSGSDDEQRINCRCRDKDVVSAEHPLGSRWAHTDCHKVCPDVTYGREEQKCSEDPHEPIEAKHHDELWWAILFLALCLLTGAINRALFPSSLPYTVILLIEAIIIGVGASLLEDSLTCPLNALRYYDADHNGKIDRSEWNDFICVDCHVNSACIKRTCGDGTEDPSSCIWSFDELNSTRWKQTAFRVEEYDDKVGDGYLTADELWRPSCNLLKDMLGVANMDPHLILLVFLPVLLFESAFAIDLGMLRTQMLQVLLLAFVGVLIASLITAAFIMVAQPDWEFNVCWMIGTILSATDPVAVVALLKDLGTDAALGTMIEGESLLNDGSAVVMYTVIKSWIEHYNGPRDDLPVEAMYPYPGGWVDLSRIIGQMLVGGVVLGLSSGWAVTELLKRVYNDKLVEVSLIVASTYIVFWLAEVVMMSSAVIAVVVMGLTINKRRSAISPEVIHFLHEFYTVLAFMYNTIIFYIAGVKLGFLFVDYAASKRAAYAWALYPGVLVSRGLTILLLFPLLRGLGMGCTWRNCVIMWWGGLRGSVGLALALQVAHSENSHANWGGEYEEEYVEDGDYYKLPCRDIPRDTLYITCIVVALTVVVNGSTVGWLLRQLGLDQIPDDRRFMLNAAFDSLETEAIEAIEHLKTGEDARYLQLVNWRMVEKRLYREELHFDIKDPNKAAWHEALNIERMIYLEQFEKGQLSPEAFKMLDSILADLQAGVARSDAANIKMQYEMAAEKFLRLFRTPKYLEQIAWTSHWALGPMRTWAKHQMVSHLSLAYQMATAYLRAQEEVSLWRVVSAASPAVCVCVRACARAHVSAVSAAGARLARDWRLVWKKAGSIGCPSSCTTPQRAAQYFPHCLPPPLDLT